MPLDKKMTDLIYGEICPLSHPLKLISTTAIQMTAITFNGTVVRLILRQRVIGYSIKRIAHIII